MTYQEYLFYKKMDVDELIKQVPISDLFEILSYEYGNHDNGEIVLDRIKATVRLKTELRVVD